jgi:hypothetical protein
MKDGAKDLEPTPVWRMIENKGEAATGEIRWLTPKGRGPRRPRPDPNCRAP